MLVLSRAALVRPFTAASTLRRAFTSKMATQKRVSSVEMSPSEARWITLKKITYTDPDGNNRPWEMAERKTRSSSGVDAVAILAILRSRKNTFPPSTVVIEQYRPPIDKICIELPAGLIDEGETAESTAIRELHEETGYTADRVLDSTPVIVSDPGMTNANMKLVTVSVWLEDELQHPQPNLEPGEYIVTKVVPLAELHDTLEEYSKNGCMVDARLSHFAVGYQFAQKIKDDALP